VAFYDRGINELIAEVLPLLLLLLFPHVQVNKRGVAFYNRIINQNADAFPPAAAAAAALLISAGQ
jgi:hypothetical protein